MTDACCMPDVTMLPILTSLPALLLPADHKRVDCLLALSQTKGGSLLSQHFADTAKKGKVGHHRSSLRHSFGGAYLEVRGRYVVVC